MTDPTTAADRSPIAENDESELPPELESLDPDRIRDLDVREQLRRGKEPFEDIMAAVSELPPDSVLRVRVTFEPEPLYGVMSSRGFRHWTEKLGEDDWRVWFHRLDE